MQRGKIPAILLALLLAVALASCNEVDIPVEETDSESAFVSDSEAISETESVSADSTAGETEVAEDTEPEPAAESQLHRLLKSSDALAATAEIVAHIPYPDDISKTEQGGYTDGVYHYQLFIKKDKESNEEDNIVRLVKYDLEKQETVAVSEELHLNHANDLTFNSREDVFVAVHNNPNRKQVSKISPDTLQIIETVEIPVKIYSMSYNETRDRYVVGLSGGQDFRILRSDFSMEGYIHGATPLTAGYTTQGCACDDAFIYFVLYKENVITVYDWDGKFVSIIHLDIPGEPENISVVGEDIYVATSAKGEAAVYKITSLEEFSA